MLHPNSSYEQLLEIGDPKQMVRNYLALLESEVRELSLSALACCPQVDFTIGKFAREQSKFFRSIAGLQKPSFGHWNGLLFIVQRLHQLNPTSPERCLDEAAFLDALFGWLRERVDDGTATGLGDLSDLIQTGIPTKPKRWDAISLGIALRNQVAHDQLENEGGAFWGNLAGLVRNLIVARLQWTLDIQSLLVPKRSPWFFEYDSQRFAFSGIRKDHVIYSRFGCSNILVPLQESRILLAMQQVLGMKEQQENSFRKLLENNTPEELVGLLVGDFLVGVPSDQGGFGVIHKGYQLSTGRQVALKVFPDLSPSQKELVRKEAERLCDFRSPLIVHGIGFYENVPWFSPPNSPVSKEKWYKPFTSHSPLKTFLAMEWIEGANLTEYFAPSPEEATSFGQLTQWFATAAQALADVHETGLAHLDITPQNLRIDSEQKLFLMDFGLARHEGERRDFVTVAKLGVGTPAYMAPEQFRGEWSRQSDVYSLCATFYELYLARRIFDHETESEQELVRAKQAGEYVSPRQLRSDLPWELATLLEAGLETEPSLRPTSSDLADDLQRVLKNQPIEFRRPPIRRRAQLWARRHREALRFATPLVLGLAIFASWLGYQYQREADRSHSLESTVSELEGEKNVAEQGRDSAVKVATLANTRASQARLNEVHDEYIADMQFIPRYWRVADVESIRGILKKYPTSDGIDPRGFEWHYWDVAVNHSSQVWGTKEVVRNFSWSSDGKTVYAAQASGAVVAWDVKAATSRVIADEEIQARRVIKHPNKDQLLVVCENGGGQSGHEPVMKMIDSSTGATLHEFRQHPFPFNSATFGPNNESVLAGGLSLIGYDAQGQAFADLYRHQSNFQSFINPLAPSPTMVHNGEIQSLACRSDHPLLATGGADGKIRLCDPHDGNWIGWLRGHSAPIVSLMFSQDGSQLVSRSLSRERLGFTAGEPGRIIVWNVATREKIREWTFSDELPPTEASGDFRAAFTDGDRQVVAGIGNSLRTWNIATGELTQEFQGHTSGIISLAVSPDGRFAVTNAADGEIRLWALDDLLAAKSIELYETHARALLHTDHPVAVLRDATTASDWYGVKMQAESDGYMRMPRVIQAIEDSDRKFEEDFGYFDCVAISPDDKFMVAYDYQQDRLLVWDTKTRRIHQKVEWFRTEKIVPQLEKEQFDQKDVPENASNEPNPDGTSSLLMGGTTKPLPAIFRTKLGPALRCLAFRDDDQLYALVGDHLWQYRISDQSLAQVHRIGKGAPSDAITNMEDFPANTIIRMTFSPDRQWLACGTAGGEIQIYETETWALVKSLRSHTREVVDIQFSSDKRRMVSASGPWIFRGKNSENDNPGEVLVWDTKTWAVALHLGRKLPSTYVGVGFGPEDREIVTLYNGSSQKSIILPGGELAQWSTQPEWDPVTKKVRHTFPDILRLGLLVEGIVSAAIHPSVHRVAALTSKGRLALWDPKTGRRIALMDRPPSRYGGPRRVTYSHDGQRLIVNGAGKVISYSPDAHLRELSNIDDTCLASDYNAEGEYVAITRESIIVGTKEYPVHRPPFGTSAAMNLKAGYVAILTSIRPPSAALDSGDGSNTKNRLEKQAKIEAATTGELDIWKLSPEPKRLHTIKLPNRPAGVGFSADGQQVFVFDQKDDHSYSIKAWECQSAKFLMEHEGERKVVGLSPDLSSVLEFHEPSSIFQYHFKTKRRSKHPVAIQSGVTVCVWFPDLKHFITLGGMQSGLKIWDANRLLMPDENTIGLVDQCYELQSSANGKRLVGRYRDGQFFAMDLTSKETVSIDSDRPLNWEPWLSEDGKSLVLNSPDGHPSIMYELTTGRKQKFSPSLQDLSEKIQQSSANSVRLNGPAGQGLMVMRKNAVWANVYSKVNNYVFNGSETIKLDPPPKNVRAARFDTEGRYLAIVCYQDEEVSFFALDNVKKQFGNVPVYVVSVYEMSTGERLAEWALSGEFRSLRFSPNSRLLPNEPRIDVITETSTHVNGHTYSLDSLFPEQPKKIIRNDNQSSSVMCLSPEGDRLACTDENGQLQVRWTANGELCWKPDNYTAHVSAATFLPNGELVTAASDSTLRQWTIPHATPPKWDPKRHEIRPLPDFPDPEPPEQDSPMEGFQFGAGSVVRWPKATELKFGAQIPSSYPSARETSPSSPNLEKPNLNRSKPAQSE